MSKRRLGLVSVLFLAFAVSICTAGTALAAASPQTPLVAAIPQFVQRLPILSASPFANLPAPAAPYLKAINTVGGNVPRTITMCEFDAKVLPPGTFLAGQQPLTKVWGYIVGTTCPTAAQETYTGPVIVNTRGTPTAITWVNNLGTTTSSALTFWKYSTDQTLAWADPLNNEANNCATGAYPTLQCAANYAGPIPAVVHLHGGEVPPELDGGPDAWFTSTGSATGHGYYSFPAAPANAATYKYPNVQEAGPAWFHDHALGITRLNVYAGLAGGYYIYDPALTLPANLQPLPEVIPIVIQDRMFDTTGQLFFPADSAGGLLYSPNPEHPYWVPEFFGDTIVVNGKAWPFLDVQQKRYRFLFLNGSNARAYMLNLGPIFWVIGTDGGYLDAPVAVKNLLIMPGERYEVIIDFAGVGGKTGKNIILTNSARAPYPKGITPNKTGVAQVMQFRVRPVAAGFVDASYNPALGTPIRQATPVNQKIVRLANPLTGTLAAGVTAAKTRQLTLNEFLAPPRTAINPVTGLATAYLGGPMEILVNNTKYEGTPRPDFTGVTVGGKTTYYSEIPKEGTTEVWEFVNLTVDAHPMHLHLVQFQLINRQNFDVPRYTAAYNLLFPGGLYAPGYGPPLNYNTGIARALGGNPDVTPYLAKGVTPPLPEEAGWKDTVVVYPGQVTRLAIRYAPTNLPTTTTAASLYFPFDPSGGATVNPSSITGGHGYVWHCHIIDHEDNEMMRPNFVTLNPAAPLAASRPLVKGVAY
jgi:FtsP/CotA-like multicopper oxidase with cupredoxin domain